MGKNKKCAVCGKYLSTTGVTGYCLPCKKREQLVFREYTPEESLLVYVLIQALVDKDVEWLYGRGFENLAWMMKSDPDILRSTISKIMRVP